MTSYINLFIAMFIFIIPIEYPARSYKKGGYGTSKHYGACLTPNVKETVATGTLSGSVK